MKKKLVSALLCVSMVAALTAGCGGSDSGDAAADGGNDAADTAAGDDAGSGDDAAADTAAADTAADGEDTAAADSGATDGAAAIQNLKDATEGTVTLDLWCSEQENYQKVIAEIVEDFKKEYSDIDFQINIGAVSESEAKDRVLEDVEAAADVYFFADDQIEDLVKAGALQEITANYTYDVKTANQDFVVEAASVDGKLYAYPMSASNGYFLYYNKEFLSEEDVASWDTMLQKAADAGKKVGMDLSNAWYLYSFFGQTGMTLSKNDDGSNSCDWNSTTNSPTGAEVAEAIEKIASNSAFISVGDTDSRAMYGQDLIAYVNGTWALDDIVKGYGEDYGAAKLPTFNAGGKDVQMGSFSGSKLVGVNAYSDQMGWAMLLAEYLTNEASQLKYGQATGEGPANANAFSQVSSPALDALAAQAEFADRQIVGDKFWDPTASLGQSLVDGTGDVQKLLDDAVAGITQAVN